MAIGSSGRIGSIGSSAKRSGGIGRASGFVGSSLITDQNKPKTAYPTTSSTTTTSYSTTSSYSTTTSTSSSSTSSSSSSTTSSTAN